VDGLGAKPLRFGPSLELQSGVLIQGTPYVVSYNNADGAFYLQGGFANPYGIPLGGMMPYIGASAPNSAFVLPFGQAISRTTYATLFSLTGTTFGAGDGSTTFNVPDLRGRGVFGQDNMGGSAAGRITVAGGNFDGTVLGGTGGAEKETLTQAQLPAVTPTFTGTQHTWNTDQTVAVTQGQPSNIPGGGSTFQNYGTGVNASVTVTPAGAIGGFSGFLGQSHPIMPPAIALPYILRII
jgi:microcystin-dependent protein